MYVCVTVCYIYLRRRKNRCGKGPEEEEEEEEENEEEKEVKKDVEKEEDEKEEKKGEEKEGGEEGEKKKEKKKKITSIECFKDGSLDTRPALRLRRLSSAALYV